jgi:protein phosphatase
MEVARLTHSRWSSTEALLEVSFFNKPNKIKGGSLASDDLYLLDLRNGEAAAQWMIVPVVGKTPGRRYGHTIVFSKPFLLVFAGNTGTEPVNDVWCLNVDKAPFSW